MNHFLSVGMSTIVSSCSLLGFASGRRMQVGAFVNKETNETFRSCIFTNPDGSKCFVAFSSKLGELSPSEIVRMKNDLQVVTMDSGSHILCKQGENTWEDVAL